MKVFTLFLSLMIISLQALPQCNDPYYHRVYQTTVERDIPYGTALAYNGVMTNLQMNIWKPVGDNNPSRPMILWIHGGGFFSGDKNDMDAIAQASAERGYVAATISYRLGFYGNLFFSAPFTYDSSEVIRAAYRAVQDARGAMRFFKGRAAQDSSNVNMAFIGGASAGSITAMHFAYADKLSETPVEGDSISDVVTLFGNVHRPALGPLDGNLNQNGQSNNVLAVVNFFGALLDTSLIESNSDPALYSYHQTGDGTVGCGYQVGLWNMPLNVSQNYPHLFGSCVIDDRVHNLGFSPQHYQSLLYNGSVHGIHDDALVDSLVARFLSDIICENLTGIHSVSEVVDVRVYPNPAKDILNIQVADADFQYALYDLNGRKVAASIGTNHQAVNINTAEMSRGMYVLHVVTSNNTFTRKIVID